MIRIRCAGWTERLLAALPWFLPLYVLRVHLGPLPTTLLEIYVLFVIATFCFEFSRSSIKTRWRALDPWRWSLLAWLLVTLLAVIISPARLAALGLWRAYVLEPLALFVVMTVALQTSAGVKRLQRSLWRVTWALAAWSLFQFLTGAGIPRPWNVPVLAGRRATGPFPFPNALALFAAPLGAWAFQVWLLRRHDRMALLTWLAALAATLVARSEGGLSALMATAWLGLLLRRRTRLWTLIITTLLIAFALIIPALRIPLLRELTFHGWSGRVRLYIWQETWRMLKDHLIFGAGFAAYPLVFKPYHHIKAIEIFQYPHNILLNFWSETGLPGVIAFAVLIKTWFSEATRRLHDQFDPNESTWSHKLALISPTLAILIHGLVDVPYFKNDLAILFWLLIFLTAVRPAPVIDVDASS